jgi:hypothetical protein
MVSGFISAAALLAALTGAGGHRAETAGAAGVSVLSPKRHALAAEAYLALPAPAWLIVRDRP